MSRRRGLLTVPALSRSLTNINSWYSGLNNTSAGHSNTAPEWYDSSGNSKTGVLSNITWGENYAQFNGTSSKVACGVQNSPSVTFDAYVEWTAITGLTEVIMSNITNGSPLSGAWMLSASKKVGMGVVVGGTLYNAYDTADAVAGVKYHYTGTYDGTTVKMYKNNVLVASTPISGVISDSSLELTLGARSNSSAFANLKLYDAARYSASITDAARTQNGQYCQSVYGT